MADLSVLSSFRDPSGFLFLRDGSIYRQVNAVYREHYERLLASGLYHALVEAGLLVPHEEVEAGLADAEQGYKIIRPELVEFVSYPYEWSFSQLKDAALATLRIAKTALDYGMCLKDASAYNIQFRNGKPTLIDTLSFEIYRPGQPWVAYRQFCQHFLAPLALMAHADVRMGQLLRVYIDGVPLDLASSLLPLRTRFSPGLALHLHLHARMQRRHGGRALQPRRQRLSPMALRGLLDSLESLVTRLRWEPRGTEWADYYQDTNYAEEAFRHKRQLVARFLDTVAPGTVWDLGANVGVFSRIAAERGIRTIAFDLDPAAVEKNYLECCARGQTHHLPLVLDLSNPSGGLGWGNQERLSLRERGPADLVLALALSHHLAISNNVPLARIARFLHAIGRSLVIEFVPKSDSQVQRLLAFREDVFSHYTQEAFERAFSEYFAIASAQPIQGSARTLYLMRGRAA